MKLLFFTPACRIGQSLLMDRAYEGDKMRAAAKKLGYNPVVPPKKNRIDPWEYDRIRAQIPESELLGIIHFNEDVMNADRSNVSPFDNSAQLVSEIITIKTKLDALDSLT